MLVNPQVRLWRALIGFAHGNPETKNKTSHCDNLKIRRWRYHPPHDSTQTISSSNQCGGSTKSWRWRSNVFGCYTHAQRFFSVRDAGMRKMHSFVIMIRECITWQINLMPRQKLSNKVIRQISQLDHLLNCLHYCLQETTAAQEKKNVASCAQECRKRIDLRKENFRKMSSCQI